MNFFGPIKGCNDAPEGRLTERLVITGDDRHMLDCIVGPISRPSLILVLERHSNVRASTMVVSHPCNVFFPAITSSAAQIR